MCDLNTHVSALQMRSIIHQTHQYEFVPFELPAPEGLRAVPTHQSLLAVNFIFCLPCRQTLQKSNTFLWFFSFYTHPLSSRIAKKTKTFVRHATLSHFLDGFSENSPVFVSCHWRSTCRCLQVLMYRPFFFVIPLTCGHLKCSWLYYYLALPAIHCLLVEFLSDLKADFCGANRGGSLDVEMFAVLLYLHMGLGCSRHCDLPQHGVDPWNKTERVGSGSQTVQRVKKNTFSLSRFCSLGLGGVTFLSERLTHLTFSFKNETWWGETVPLVSLLLSLNGIFQVWRGFGVVFEEDLKAAVGSNCYRMWRVQWQGEESQECWPCLLW